MYNETIKDIMQKAINDEISSVIFYLEIANKLSGASANEFRQIMLEHADEEMTHFKLLLEKSANLGIEIKPFNYRIDFIDNLNLMMTKVQELEEEARVLYNFATELTRKENDFELETFFKELLEDETTHFDDVAKITGEKRNFIPPKQTCNVQQVSQEEQLPDFKTYIQKVTEH